jgi:hypothetical protein
MTEAEWLTSTDPQAMLHYLQIAPIGVGGRRRGTEEGGPVLVSDRKLRLFACACCRSVWDGAECQRCNSADRKSLAMPGVSRCLSCHGTGLVGGITDPRSRRAVEVAERYADGEATDEELLPYWQNGEEGGRCWSSGPHAYAAWCCAWAHQSRYTGADRTTIHAQDCGGKPADQAALLREIVGNPFRPVPWQRRPHLLGERVFDVAQSIYDERAFDRLPMLADALLDAGCYNAEILEHCRGREKCSWCQGTRWVQYPRENRGAGAAESCKVCTDGGMSSCTPHVRGCWALDTILGRE